MRKRLERRRRAGGGGSSPGRSRHDLLAEKTVLKTAELGETFTELFVQYVRTFHPSSPAEFDLIDNMTSAAWRIRRLWVVETSMTDSQVLLQKTTDPVTGIAGSLTTLADTPRFHHLSRIRPACIGCITDRCAICWCCSAAVNAFSCITHQSLMKLSCLPYY